MNPKSKPDADRQPKRQGPPPGMQEHLRRAEEAKRRKQETRTTLLRAVGIGGFAIIAVMACLEGLKRESTTNGAILVESHRTPESAATRTTPAKPSPSTETPAIPTPKPAPSPEIVPPPVVPPPVVPDTPAEIADNGDPKEADLIAKEAPLLLTGQDASREAAITRHKAILDRTIKGKAWNAYRGLLERSIRAGLAQISEGRGLNRFDPVWNEGPLYQALLRWRTLGWFSEARISEHVEDAYSGGFIEWLLNRDKQMEEFLLTIRPQDDAGKVLKFLMDAWATNETAREKYFPLALACAVVFDRPVSIPNPIASEDFPAESEVNPIGRYNWFIEKNEKGKLAAPVHRSSARDLVWVVCAPVTTAEMEWSLRHMSLRRSNWGNAYGMVEYLMDRAVKGENPYKEYSFKEILKEGGICGDQSYFCVNTARAQGIPAMILGGETSLGGHAWAGLKTDDDEWTTSVGRIGGVSKGQTSNPQTGASITEQEILQWNDRHHRSPAVSISVWRHFWLGDFFAATGEDEKNAAAVHLATKIGPSFTEAWACLYELLEKQMQLTGDPPVPCNLAEWKDFAADMRREFKNNPRMAELAANAELEYIFPYGKENDARRALLRERIRLERNASEQTDLIASSLKREADLLVKRGGPDAKREISQLYDRALRDYGGSITGFKMMAENYFSYFKDDKEMAHKAARDIELAFKRVVETGSTDWFRANTESSIYQMICGYYRASGDPERAQLLEKRYQVLLRRAKRAAR